MNLERRAAEDHSLQPINGEVIYDARAGSWEQHTFSAVHFSLWAVVPHICDLDLAVGSHSSSRRHLGHILRWILLIIQMQSDISIGHAHLK